MAYHRRGVAAAVLASAALTGCTTFDSTLGMGSLVSASVSPASSAVSSAVSNVDPFVTGSVVPEGASVPGPLARPAMAAPSGGYNYALVYSSTTVDGVALPAVDYDRVGYDHLRADVPWFGDEAPGDIVIDTSGRHLYLVGDNGRAIRYGIAVGREGFGWTGTEKLSWKRSWPTWTPPREMIEREPDLARWAEGMPGGASNPLGARALYLGDTLYRIHGTDKPYSVGKAASSGCFRMINQDVIDLYERAQPGATVHVRSGVGAAVASN